MEEGLDGRPKTPRVLRGFVDALKVRNNACLCD